MTAGEAQFTVVPGERARARMVHTLAAAVTALDEEISELEAQIEARFRVHSDRRGDHQHARHRHDAGRRVHRRYRWRHVCVGSSDRLAGVAGLAPVPRDSGKVSGNLRRPRRYSRRLLRMFYLSAQVATVCCLESKRYHQRERAEGKSHKQAVLALARRRLNVLWALLRDHKLFETAAARRRDIGMTRPQWVTTAG